MKQEALLKKHFTNSLSKDEQDHFFKLLDEDPEFKELYNEYKDMHQAFKIKETEDLKSHLKVFEQKNSSSSTSPKRKLWRYYGAAAVILLLFSVYFLRPTPANDLYNTYFNHYPNVERPIIRGADKNDVYLAFKAYEHKDFGLAESYFKSYLETQEDFNIRFYYAMALLNQNKLDLALTQLNLIEKSSSNYLAETLWYKALIQLKNKNYSLSKKTLLKLTQTDPDFMPEKVARLLKALD